MDINVRKEGDVAILALEGDLILGASVAAFREKVQDLVEAGEKKILVNLTSVRFVDSSGIGSMVGAHTSLESVGGRCKFCGAQQRVLRALDLTHMRDIFDMHEREATALASFGAGTQGT